MHFVSIILFFTGPLDETEGMRSIPSIRVFGASFTVDASGIPKFCKFEDMDSMDEDTVGGGEHTWKVGDGDDIFGGSSDHASSGCGGRRWSFSRWVCCNDLATFVITCNARICRLGYF